MVDFIDDPLRLERDLNRFAFSPGCPDGLAEKLQNIPGSQADKISQGARILYAHYDELDEAGKIALAQILQYAVNKNWSEYVSQTSAAEVVNLISIDLGEQGETPVPAFADWPAPDTQRRDGADWRQPEEEPAQGE